MANAINNTTNLDDFVNPVEKKITEISRELKKSLNGSDNFEAKVQEKIKSIIREEEIKTKNDEIDDLTKTIARELGAENTAEIKVESKKIRLEIEKLEERNPKEFINFKKEEFKKKLIEEVIELNPEIKKEELNSAKEYGEMVAETYLGENIIDGEKDNALEVNSQYGPGRLENAWTDLKGTTKFLAKKPGEIKEIQQKYESVKSGLKNVNLPDNLRELRSFENVISGFNDSSTNNLFLRTQKYLGWFDRVDKLTGGWLTKTTGKVGSQMTNEFAKNSLGVMAEQGFKQGFSSVLKGIMSGGVRTAASTAATASTAAGAAGTAATAAGAAAVSATGVGAIIVAAAAIIKAAKGAMDKIAEKLGVSAKKFLEENFGKAGGAIISGAGFLVGLPVLLIGAISATVMTPIILIALTGLFGYQMFMGNAVASVVPPKSVYDDTDLKPVVTDGHLKPIYIEYCMQSDVCNLINYLSEKGVVSVNSGNWNNVKNLINQWKPVSSFFDKDFFVNWIDGVLPNSRSGKLQCIVFAQATNNILKEGTIGKEEWWNGNTACSEVSSGQASSGDFIHFPTSYHHIQVLSVLRGDGSFEISEANWDDQGGLRNMAGDNIDEYIVKKNAKIWHCSNGNTPGVLDSNIANLSCNEAAKKVLLINQLDNDTPMMANGELCGGKVKTISTSGCGPVSVAQILEAKNKTWTPDFLVTNTGSPYINSYQCGSGTSLETARKTLVQYLTPGSDNNIDSVNYSCSEDTIKKMLCEHKAVIVSLNGNKNRGETWGHIAVAVGYNNGEIMIADPIYGEHHSYPSWYNSNGYYNLYIGGCLGVDVSLF